MTRYAVRHETVYNYGRPVNIGLHLLWLSPLNTFGQSALSQTLTINPDPARTRAFKDHFSNVVHHVAVEMSHRQFSVTLDAQVEVDRGGVHDDGPPWEQIRDRMRDDGFPSPPDVAEFVYPSPLAPIEDGATQFAASSFTAARPIVSAVRDLISRIHAQFVYTPNLTDISTKVAEVIAMKRGVCQDFAHLMIAGLRGRGLPARYVSGYIRTLPSKAGAFHRGSDASHAWVSVWCGDSLGWIEFDPTNDRIVENEHIVVAYGRDYSDVTPLRGVILGGGRHTLSVGVDVTELPEQQESQSQNQSQNQNQGQTVKLGAQNPTAASSAA